MSADCAVTAPVAERPPDDPRASTFQGSGTWYANQERTLWAAWLGQTAAGDYKVLWVRPAGGAGGITITGRRIDGGEGNLTAHIPCCYPWTFQATGVGFSRAGCWEVQGRTEQDSLKFVVKIP